MLNEIDKNTVKHHGIREKLLVRNTRLKRLKYGQFEQF
jgi:hypothetical protein